MQASDFPTKDRFKAKSVTELDFDLKYDMQQLGLYVDLSGVRSNRFVDDIRYQLLMEDGHLANISDDFQKILFSGHKGCGKTTELKRLHQSLNKPEAYFSLLVELEKETYLSRIEPEDVFVLLILKLLEELHERGVDYSTSELDDIANEWLSEEELKTEVYEHSKDDAQVGFDTGLLSLLSLKGSIRSMWTAGSKTTKAIRTKVKQNPTELINKFNLFLAHLRLKLEESGLGKDVVFIVDGSEKMRHETYSDLFIKDSILLRQLDCNMVVAVPIDAYYTIENSPHAFTHSVTIPMVRTEDQAAEKLKSIITVRLDEETFFESGVIEEFVKYSGGCVRQLLLLVNQGLMRSLGAKITMAHAQQAISELGQRMFEQLKVKHLELLRENDPDKWPPGEELVREMLFSLALLKYNGVSGINPLIKDRVLGNR